MQRHAWIVPLVLTLLIAGCTDILLPRGTAVVKGHVTLNGEAPGAAEVYVVATGTRFYTKVNADGAFSLELPAPANYTLSTGGPGVAATVVPVRVGKGDALDGVDIDAGYLPPPPSPEESLIWLDFDLGLENQGLWGGVASLTEYAPNEGPRISPNVGLGRSGALDFMRASRSGGSVVVVAAPRPRLSRAVYHRPLVLRSRA